MDDFEAWKWHVGGNLGALIVPESASVLLARAKEKEENRRVARVRREREIAKPDPSSSNPLSLADIAYALEYLDGDQPAHVDARAAGAVEEVETVLRISLTMAAAESVTGSKIFRRPLEDSPLVAKIRQLLGMKHED